MSKPRLRRKGRLPSARWIEPDDFLEYMETTEESNFAPASSVIGDLPVEGGPVEGVYCFHGEGRAPVFKIGHHFIRIKGGFPMGPKQWKRWAEIRAMHPDQQHDEFVRDHHLQEEREYKKAQLQERKRREENIAKAEEAYGGEEPWWNRK